MRAPIRLGRLFNIDVAFDQSWLLLFALMCTNLTVVFRHWHPAWSLGGCIALALVAALLFFSSVIAHEFSHALVARRFDVTVREIRLFLFGGVASCEREPGSARAEFCIAIAGPIMSFFLGVAFLLGAELLLPGMGPGDPSRALARLGPAETLLLWLGAVNLGVGLFNLVPGFPLDGGRILHAAIWQVTGDLRRSTRIASGVGQLVGWGFVMAGLAMFFGVRLPLFGRGAASGLWMALIGWFLSAEAGQSYQALLILQALEGVRVGSLMRRHGAAIAAETTLDAAVSEWFIHSEARAFPVLDGGSFVGVLNASDLRKVPRDAWERTPVTQVMTPVARLAAVSPTDEAAAALRRFAELDVEQLPVLAGSEFVGMLARGDIARWLEFHLGAPGTGGAEFPELRTQ